MAPQSAPCSDSFECFVVTLHLLSQHEEEPPAPPPEPPAPAAARPGWRVVNKRAERKERALGKAQRPPSPGSVPPLEPPKPNVPAWAQWRRASISVEFFGAGLPCLAATTFTPQPTPGPSAAPLPRSSSPPPRSGLFGTVLCSRENYVGQHRVLLGPSTPPPK